MLGARQRESCGSADYHGGGVGCEIVGGRDCTRCLSTRNLKAQARRTRRPTVPRLPRRRQPATRCSPRCVAMTTRRRLRNLMNPNFERASCWVARFGDFCEGGRLATGQPGTWVALEQKHGVPAAQPLDRGGRSSSGSRLGLTAALVMLISDTLYSFTSPRRKSDKARATRALVANEVDTGVLCTNSEGWRCVLLQGCLWLGMRELLLGGERG